MYSFQPSEEQQMLIEAIKRYAMDDLRAAARDAEEEGQLPPELIEKGWELGYLQASIPEAYTGFGERSAVTGVLAAEEFAYGDLAGALAVLTPGLFATPILLAGTEAQKEQYIPPVIEMEWKPFTAALMEPHFDFDPNELRTTAKADGDSYVLEGEKCYVPYAADAEAMIVYASLEGVTQGFIVPGNAEGLEVGERMKLLGLNALPLYPVSLKGVRVPKENRLGGEEGHDFAPILAASNVALAAFLLTGVVRVARGWERAAAVGLCVLLILKMSAEWITGVSLFVAPQAGWVPLPVAHLAGALVGLVMAASAWRGLAGNPEADRVG